MAASSRSEHASVERDPIFGDRVDREFASEPPTVEYSNNRVVVSVLTYVSRNLHCDAPRALVKLMSAAIMAWKAGLKLSLSTGSVLRSPPRSLERKNFSVQFPVLTASSSKLSQKF